MPTTLAADPDGVYDHGTKFVEHGARLVGMVGGLQADLDGYGEVWGQDIYGVQFSANYNPGTQSVLDSTGGLSGVVGSAGQNLQETALAYRQAEINAET